MRPRGEVRKWPWNIVCACEIENGPDILSAASSEDISLSIMSGKLREEGRFPGMKVCHSGGGLPIGEPKVMSLTRKGKREVISKLSRVRRQPSAMYGVVCIYRTELSSITGAGRRSMDRITTEGAGVRWVA